MAGASLRRWAPVLAAAALGCVVTACGAPTPAATFGATAAPTLPVPRSSAAQFTAARQKPDFSLTDTQGRTFDFRRGTLGRVTLLYFGYTHCPDQCPTTMAGIAEALRRLTPAARTAVRVVFVTTDPARDTPAQLGQWLGRFDPAFVGLTGTARDVVAAQQKALGLPLVPVDVGPATIGHAVGVIAYDRSGVQRATFSPAALPGDYVRGLLMLLDGR